MNNALFVGLVSVVALAVMTLYWRRRERIVRESLTVSREWEQNAVSGNAAATGAEQRAAADAARQLDAAVTDLPERVEALDSERRELRRELDAVRERWADSWWASREATTGSAEPPVRVVAFDRWELPDARAFAKRAMEEECITVVVALDDDSFGVAVGESLRAEFSASEIATRITESVGGGAGGTDGLATGGGATGDLPAACRRVETALRRSDAVRAGDSEGSPEP